jgi:hypothetical protein
MTQINGDVSTTPEQPQTTIASMNIVTFFFAMRS